MSVSACVARITRVSCQGIKIETRVIRATHGTHSRSRTLLVTQIRSELKSTVAVLGILLRGRVIKTNICTSGFRSDSNFGSIVCITATLFTVLSEHVQTVCMQLAEILPKHQHLCRCYFSQK